MKPFHATGNFDLREPSAQVYAEAENRLEKEFISVVIPKAQFVSQVMGAVLDIYRRHSPVGVANSYNFVEMKFRNGYRLVYDYRSCNYMINYVINVAPHTNLFALPTTEVIRLIEAAIDTLQNTPNSSSN